MRMIWDLVTIGLVAFIVMVTRMTTRIRITNRVVACIRDTINLIARRDVQPRRCVTERGHAVQYAN